MRKPVVVGQPLTPQELVVTEMLATGKHNYVSIAEQLRIGKDTVRLYAYLAARKIESDLPTQLRLVVWWRQHHGIDVLTGRKLRPEYAVVDV